MSAPVLPPDLRAALQAWHDELGYECVAASEGQWCCVDVLLRQEPDHVGVVPEHTQ